MKENDVMFKKQNDERFSELIFKILKTYNYISFLKYFKYIYVHKNEVS